MDTPSIAAVILNWKGWRDTLDCLGALKKSAYPNLSVIVVDNGSPDDSVARIRAAYPNIPLIENAANLGFGGGINPGIRHALKHSADFVWLLNNDTQPSPQAAGALVAKAMLEPGLGAVGSVLRYAHDPSKVQAWGGGRVNRWLGISSHCVVAPHDASLDFLTAASVLIRRRALEEIGLFDETFFLYWEDTDLSFRLRARGWKLGVAADAIVLHKENASSTRRAVDRFSTASGIRFLQKHSPFPLLSVPMFLGIRILVRLGRGDIRQVSDIVGGLSDYLRSRSASSHPSR